MFNRLKSKQDFSGQDLLEDFIDFHAHVPRSTESAFGSTTNAKGQTTYEFLLEAAGDLTGKVILDLACADGPLCGLVLERFPNVKQVIGIDASSIEIVRARERISSPKAIFKSGRAQELPLGPASVDVVFCHMALMLFDPLMPAIKEFVRVLKPGGTFAALMPHSDAGDEIFFQAYGVLKEIALKENPHLQQAIFGDPKLHSREGLKEVFGPPEGFAEEIAICGFNTFIKGRPDELASRLLSFFYLAQAITPQGQNELKARWMQMLQDRVQDREVLELKIPFIRIAAFRLP